MADQDRAAADALIESLKREPWRFDFFQALRLLENHYAERPRLGTSQVLHEDPPLRLGQNVSLDFPATALASWNDALAVMPERLQTWFFGLFGPNGPLPLHLSEYALQQAPDLPRFADVFHHRLLCLFYRAWAEAQPTVQFDRHAQDEDRFSHYLAALFGLGMDSLRDRDALPDLAKLSFAGHLSCQTRHADGLQALLAAHFGVPVRIEEFIGEWMDIAAHEQTRLGENRPAGLLGQSAVLGARVFGCQHKIRVVLGPLSLEAYLAMLPRQAGAIELAASVRNYTGDELAWEVNLILRHEEIPPLRLDGSAQLGLTSWLGCKDGDADDLTLCQPASTC